MLGEEDHNEVNNEPINAEDLFGDDLFGDNENEQSNENEANNEENASATQTPAATKKHRILNRLPNLNDVWLTDSRRENIRTVNGYFEKIKFRKGKGQEHNNLKTLLQRYEYFGQNCYPKLCFKDFVEKVEGVSGKRSIKHVLQDIRNGRDFIDNPDSDDNDDPAMNIEEPVPNVPDPDQPLPNSLLRESSPTPAPEPTPPPKPMTDEMREFIRKKREEALVKRKQKLNESLNQSSTNAQHDAKDVSQNEQQSGNDDESNHSKEQLLKDCSKVSGKSEGKEVSQNLESKNSLPEKVNSDSELDCLDDILPKDDGTDDKHLSKKSEYAQKNNKEESTGDITEASNNDIGMANDNNGNDISHINKSEDKEEEKNESNNKQDEANEKDTLDNGMDVDEN